MKKEDLTRIGYFTKTHGLKGELQAHFSIVPKDVHDIKTIFVNSASGFEPYFIKIASYNKQKAIVEIEDINSLESAKKLIGQDVYVDKKLIDNEEYLAIEVLIGYQVIDVDTGTLGLVQDYFNMPGHDVLAMSYQEKEVLIPFVEAIVLGIDQKNRQLQVRLPDGLLEVYLNEDNDVPDDMDDEEEEASN